MKIFFLKLKKLITVILGLVCILIQVNLVLKE